MKLLNTLSISALILTASIAGTASANISTGSLVQDVQSAVGSGHVSVGVVDGVAILFGGVESRLDANAAELAAANFEGIERVENYLSISN